MSTDANPTGPAEIDATMPSRIRWLKCAKDAHFHEAVSLSVDYVATVQNGVQYEHQEVGRMVLSGV